MLKSEAFFKHIKDWIVYSQDLLYTMKDRPDLTCYGLGSNAGGNSWGMQTNAKACAAFLCAATEPSIDWTGTGLTREKVLEQGLGLMRFTFESHRTGSYHTTNGAKWGHGWITNLGTTRMLHAINAVSEYLTDEDRAAMRRVLISESDWLLNEYKITAGLIEDNHPESNIWNGAILYQTACLYPDAPNAKAYKAKATRFLINGISTESDEFSKVVYDGIRVKDAFIGANMFDTMACNHHKYMNVGYMVICLSNLAMLYFWCRDLGFPLPEAFDHHVLELWEIIRSCTFEDGRLWRIGGDSRVRYCYCQDYALPMWALMSEKYGIDCDSLFEGWLEQVNTEVKNNGDGSFLSDRLSFMKRDTPYYYARLESDRAVTLTMIGYWRRKYELGGKKKQKLLTDWYDPYHGSILKTNGKARGSFTWIAGQRPTAMLVPYGESNLAEWQQNMTGRACSYGALNEDRVICHTEHLFDGGFLTYGKSASESKRFYCEGYVSDIPAVKTIAYAQLSDGVTALSIQRAISPDRIYERCYSSIMYRVPNDTFNENERSFITESDSFTLKGGRFAEEKDISVGKWVSVEGKMGIASTEPLTLRSPKFRQIDLVIKDNQDSTRADYGTLYVNDVVGAYSDEPKWFNPGDEIYRCVFAANVGSADDTRRLADSLSTEENDGIISAKVTDSLGCEYIMALNISGNRKTVEIPEGFVLLAGEDKLDNGEAALMKRV